MIDNQIRDYNTYNPKSKLSFFEQLPYDIVCYILLFVEKDYDNDICNKLKDPCLINIIRFDKYINSYRKYVIKINLTAFNYNILRIMSGMSGLAYAN
jgi:hypothetical protein